jgi:hypothetical protein
MLETARRITRSCFSFIVCFLIIFNVLPVTAQDVYLCVWRNPERTMTRIFPDARDYRTVNAGITPDQRKVIEKIVGYELLPGQQDQFQYFEMMDQNGQVIGTIIPSTQKGEFGAVEFVFGMDTDLRIADIYIQRARERDQFFKERDFLDLFVGRSVQEKMSLDQLYNGNPTPGTRAVVTGLIKAMVAYDVLVAARPTQDDGS